MFPQLHLASAALCAAFAEKGVNLIESGAFVHGMWALAAACGFALLCAAAEAE
ncbi:hypothetical protein [Ancylobacter lacus]|uniref:hypothetical protein n=1 Tax=Ancylobacter lacus TaxID=2579970 RepID=UPI001BD0A668|nr:hypothetical protein [Ancylobacter lacus]MBS7538770.1 hypothetical protein [Ancylobacter lacus]